MLAASFVVAGYLAGNQSFHNFLLHLGGLEYLGAFFAGMLFVSSFTIATSTVVIAILAENIHPLALGLIGASGAVIGDLLIFKVVKTYLTDELALLFGRQELFHLKSIAHSKYLGWTLPLIGVFVIASPLPDELGVSLLGLSKISDIKFILVSFLSNAIGILMVASVVKVF